MFCLSDSAVSVYLIRRGLVSQVNPETGYIDYDRLQENARLFHPRLIIAGA